MFRHSDWVISNRSAKYITLREKDASNALIRC